MTCIVLCFVMCLYNFYSIVDLYLTPQRDQTVVIDLPLVYQFEHFAVAT